MKMNKRQYRLTDMTKGDSLKLIVRLALPLAAAAVIQQLFSMTDAVILGLYEGNHGIAVMGTCSWTVWLQVSILTNMGQASCLLAAKRFGAGEEEPLKYAIGNIYFVAVLSSLIMIPGLQAIVEAVIRLQDTPPDVFADAVLYLRIIYAGTIFLLIYNILSSVLRAAGDSYTSFQAISVSAAANVILSWILIAFFDMGIKGAAIGTSISQSLAALICVMKLQKYPVLRIRLKHLMPNRELLTEFIGLCIPMMAQSFVIAAGGTYVQAHVNHYGTEFMAGVSASVKIFSLVETGAVALASASSSFISQNVGARRFDRIESAVKQVCGLTEGIAGVLAVLLLFIGKKILVLYVDGEAVTYAMENLIVYCAGLLLMYPMYSLRQAVQALGNTWIPLAAALLQLAMRIIAVSVLPVYIGRAGIYFASFLSWLVSLILIGLIFPVQLRKGRGGNAILKKSKMDTSMSKTEV